jgi:hypothetical protein
VLSVLLGNLHGSLQHVYYSTTSDVGSFVLQGIVHYAQHGCSWQRPLQHHFEIRQLCGMWRKLLQPRPDKRQVSAICDIFLLQHNNATLRVGDLLMSLGWGGGGAAVQVHCAGATCTCCTAAAAAAAARCSRWWWQLTLSSVAWSPGWTVTAT